MTTILRAIAHPTHNPVRGFVGAICRHADPKEAWPVALEAISSRTGRRLEAVGAFLASRYGREFADDVAGKLAEAGDLSEAIGRAVECWMDRRTDARLEDELGIPEGLPYLTGLVCMYEARLEASGSVSVSGQ